MFIIFLILFSSIILVIDDPLLDPESELKMVLYFIDFIITLLFCGEALLKILALGFLINGKNSYLR
jgi:hypothetical protein